MDVIELRPRNPAPKPDDLKSVFGEDEWILKLCAEWRMVRAQQQKNWAEDQLAKGWGYLPAADKQLDCEPLERMQQIEWHLGQAKPRTILLARELLGICVTILAHEDPESTLAQGPVLEMVRNVISSLDFEKGPTRIGPKPPRGKRKR